MARWHRWYLYGMMAVIALCAFGELIWVPDVLRIGQLYWIDLLNGLVFALVVPPLLWAGGAVMALLASFQGYSPRDEEAPGGKPAAGFKARRRWLLVRHGSILLMAALAAGLLCYMGIVGELSLLLLAVAAGSIVLIWLLAIWDAALHERYRGGRLPWRSLLALVLSATLLSGLFWPTSQMVTYPGLAVNMNRYVHVEGGQPHGEIMGLLVFDRPAFLADWLYAKLFPAYTFRPIETLGMSLGQYESLVRDLKAEADQIGSAIALHEAGIGAGVKRSGAKVVLVEVEGPAHGELKPGDIIVQVNDAQVASLADLRAQMADVVPGSTVRLALLRDGERLSREVLTKGNPEQPGQAIMGIQVTDSLEPDLPRKVAFRRYFAHEGGPSHGAALALALLDQLIPGGVTNGHRVAVTGTIDADGQIGRIGGIRQKAFTAKRDGADVFFVPKGQEEEAQAGAPGLRIIPVDTFEEMLIWLRRSAI